MAFDDPSTSDLQISIDGHIIHAHKALLRMRCDYFRSRFQEHWKDESDRFNDHNFFSIIFIIIFSENNSS